ncbi:MAG TPA: hypothetical protein PL009_07015 [Flavipsychrobacter sp.]|nr:hypothetical protein [Flavipsychrobacter sp.]
MAYKRKSWAEKMNAAAQHKVEMTDKAFSDIPEGSKMLIATPQIVDAYVRNIPEGTHITLQQMRKDLATEYNADYSCPVTSGIFVRIVAEHAYEELQQGKSIDEIAPFWRIIDLKAPTAKKLTFGTDFLKEQRQKEGLPV